jgi:membrane protein YdbS with pleckstrin-like domain
MLARIDERVCLEARRHGVVLARPLLRALVLAGAGVALLLLPWLPALVLGALLLAFAAFATVRNVWRWERTRLVITTEKLFVVHGTLRRRAAAVRLARVDSLELEQGLLGRLLGYGTLVAGPLEVSHVAKPRQVFRLLERLCG